MTIYMLTNYSYYKLQLTIIKYNMLVKINFNYCFISHCRSAVHFRRIDNRRHRLRVPAQVLHNSRGGLRHAVRPAHHH